MQRLVQRISATHQKWLCLHIRPSFILHSTTGPFVWLHNCLTKAWKKRSSVDDSRHLVVRLAVVMTAQLPIRTPHPTLCMAQDRAWSQPLPSHCPFQLFLLLYGFDVRNITCCTLMTLRSLAGVKGSKEMAVTSWSAFRLKFIWRSTKAMQRNATLVSPSLFFYTTLLHKLRKRANY
jgi:hypothetical protein